MNIYNETYNSKRQAQNLTNIDPVHGTKYALS